MLLQLFQLLLGHGGAHQQLRPLLLQAPHALLQEGQPLRLRPAVRRALLLQGLEPRLEASVLLLEVQRGRHLGAA